ncbi:MAG: sn-glycerol-3-phosphate dehydrogenase subunit C [Chloroflexi bacterium RBG_16_47_49]|nr:MAG: sn-glycerol-3-phosphate dehydrogenase subunit C [Chloroflexi bacterium RBG_16_47_49]
MNAAEQTLPEFSIDQCIKCNICTAACPVSAVTDLFPGPKYEGPQAGRFRGPNQSPPDKSVDYCSGCRVCNLACPTGVKIAEINARARAALVAHGNLPIHLRLRNNLIARPELLGKFAHPISSLANTALNLKPARWFAEFALGIHHSAPLPPFSRQLFTTWFRSHPKPSHPLRKVVYFHGCSTQYYEPRVGRAAIHVLEANGFEVIVPRQNCCGLPLLSNGEFGAARKYHANNVKSLVNYARQGVPIVGTSTSCTLTLKEEAPDLLEMHDMDARLVAECTYDFNEFLSLLLDEGSLNLNFNPIPLTLGYHIPCQYRSHRIGNPGRQILNLIPALNIIDSRATCCGIAGTYGYKKEKYEIAMDVGKSLFNFICEGVPNSPVVVCDSETCRWQITHATGRPAIHPVELIAKSYGLPVEGVLVDI